MTVPDAGRSGPPASSAVVRVRPRRGLRSRLATHRALLLELLGANLFALAAGLPFVRDGRVVLTFDTVAYTGPNAALSAREWTAGRLPQWNDTPFGGIPHLANPQGDALYPLKLPFVYLDTFRAVEIVSLLHLLVLATGMVLLLRCGLGLRAPAGFVGAIALVGSGMVIARSIQFEQMVAIAWMPWVLLGIDRILSAARSPRWALAFTAVVTAIMLTGAHPQPLFEFAPFAAGWALVRAYEHDALRRLGAVIGAAGAGVFLAAPQLLPAALFTSEGALIGKQTLESVGNPAYVVQFHRILNTVLGDPFTPNPGFASGSNESMTAVGAGVVTLAALGALACWQGRRRVTIAFLATSAALSLVLALGPRTPVFRAAFRWVPGFNTERVPSRWRDVTVVALVLLAAYGVDAVARRKVHRRVAPTAGLILALAFGVLLFGHPALPEWRVRVAWMAAVAVILGSTMVIARHGRRPLLALFAAGAVSVVPLVELGAVVPHNFPHLLSMPTARADHPGALPGMVAQRGGRLISYASDKLGDPRYLLDTVRPNANGLDGIRSIDGYDGGVLVTKRWVAAVSALAGTAIRPEVLLKGQMQFPLDPNLWARFGVRWLLIDTAVQPAKVAAPDWHGPVLREGTLELWENPVTVTEARLYVSAVARPVEVATADALRSAAADQAVIEPGATGLDCQANCGVVAVALERPHPGAIDATVDATATSLLVVDEQYLPGWHATVDGRAAPVETADGMFAGLRLTPGIHRVSLRYTTPGLHLGLAMAASALLALALYVGWPRRNGPESGEEPAMSFFR